MKKNEVKTNKVGKIEEMIINAHKEYGYSFTIGETLTQNCGVLLDGKYKVQIYKAGNWFMRIEEWIDNGKVIPTKNMVFQGRINRIDEKDHRWNKKVVENAAKIIADAIDEYEAQLNGIRRDLIVSAIKDAVRANSTEKYSVGGGYLISVPENEDEGNVVIYDKNGFIDYYSVDDDEWLFNKGDAIEKIADYIFEDFGEEVEWEGEQPCVNVEDFIENGCNVALPEEFVKTFDGKNVIINYDTYPCSPKIHWSKKEYAPGEWEKEFQEKYKGPESRVAVVKSPKTYGDLMKPYVDDIADMIQKIESGELKDWDYIHSLGELWVEGFDFDNDMVSLSIGS